MNSSYYNKLSINIAIILIFFLAPSPFYAQELIGYEITATHIYTSNCSVNDTPLNKTTVIDDATLTPPFTFHYIYIATCRDGSPQYATQIQDSTGRWIDIGNYCLSSPPENHPCGVNGTPGGTITYIPIYLEPEKQFGMPMQCNNWGQGELE